MGTRDELDAMIEKLQGAVDDMKKIGYTGPERREDLVPRSD